MNVKTSFFNKKIFTSTVSKILPVCCFVIFFCFLYSLASTKNYFHQMNIQNSFSGSVFTGKQVLAFCNRTFAVSGFCKIMMVIYSFLVGIASFSYLYNQKLCKTMHMLPVTRGCMFISKCAAGFAVIIIPYFVSAITAGIICAINGFNFFYPFLAFAIACGYSFIFYSITIFSVMITGHIIAVPILFLFLNFGYIIITFIIRAVTNSMFFGLSLVENLSYRDLILTPIIYLFSFLNFEKRSYFLDTVMSPTTKNVFLVFGIYIVLSIVLFVVSFLIYKYRKLETSGDPIVTKKLQPVFHYLVTIIGGALSSIIIYAIFERSTSQYLDLPHKIILFVLFLVCSIIIFYIIKMLLSKTIKVFKTKNYGIIVYMALSLVIFITILTDIFGIEKYTPEKDRIETAELLYDGTVIKSNENSPELIDKIVEIHENIIDNRDDLILSTANLNTDNTQGHLYYGSIIITYKLNSGKVVKREYPIYSSESINKEYPELAKLQNNIISIASKPELICQELDEIKASENSYIDIYSSNYDDYYYVDPINYVNIINALIDDIKEGNLQYRYIRSDEDEDDTDYQFQVSVSEYSEDYYLDFRINDKCKHTLDAINKYCEKDFYAD